MTTFDHVRDILDGQSYAGGRMRWTPRKRCEANTGGPDPAYCQLQPEHGGGHLYTGNGDHAKATEATE